MKTTRIIGVIAAFALAGAVAATADEGQGLSGQVGDTLQMFRASGHRLQHLFDTADGYAIFPCVGKGAVGIGVAEGDGQVFEKGALVGTAKLTQITVGAQLGGQSYAEVIFFKAPWALDEFKNGQTAMSAGVSAIVAGDGAADEAKYQNGVIVCTMERSGLMFEASIGAQHFKFTPLTTSGPEPSVTRAAPASTAAPAATQPASTGSVAAATPPPGAPSRSQTQ
ncbi:MAG TPA: hypothetical protein VMP11_07150 [Verrucomicrobiae bacterium]|nr:hypothetical protein [Verrucomicrobiae bacterium]